MGGISHRAEAGGHCSRVKQHNSKKARWAAGSRRVALLTSRVVAALVPDKRPDRQRTVQQAGPTLRPKVEGRCGLCRRCDTCELESRTRPTLLLLLLLKRRGACTNTAKLRNPEESQQGQVLHSCRCPVRVAPTPAQQSARRQGDRSRVRSVLAAVFPEDAAPAPAQQSAWDPIGLKQSGSSSSQRPHAHRLCTQTGASACSRNLLNADTPAFQSLTAVLQPVSWTHGPEVSQPGLCEREYSTCTTSWVREGSARPCHVHHNEAARPYSAAKQPPVLHNNPTCCAKCRATTKARHRARGPESRRCRARPEARHRA